MRKMTVTCPALLGIALMIILATAGCKSKKGTSDFQDEPTKMNSTEAASKPAAGTNSPFPYEGMNDISDNPGFFQVEDRAASNEATKRLDEVLRLKFKELLKDVKLVSETSGPDPEIKWRDDLLNRLIYVPRRLMDQKDGDDLHTMLTSGRNPHFAASPRYGAKPQHGRTSIIMSFTTTIKSQHYSLGIRVDLEKQTIQVDSFKIGTKYDRL